MNPNEQQLDPSIVALTKAIGHQESGGDYAKVGDNGHSVGAYQWNNPTPLAKGQVPKNFVSFASEVGADPNDFSATNQDRVAYKTVEKWGKQGLTPAQIASKWNSGSPDSYKTAQPGYNADQGVNYDVGAYVNNVAKYYDTYKGQTSGYNPKPYSNPEGNSQAPGQFDLTGSTSSENKQPQTDTLGSELTNRTNDLASAVGDTIHGKINPISGILQVGGAIAGGIGDVVNKGLELIPGVKQLESFLGQSIQGYAGTPIGQTIVKSLQDFSQNHPELSKDIGAGFNILTAIPILKGLSVIKNVALDGASQALKGIAEKTFTKDLTNTVAKTVGGRKALALGGDEIGTLIKERALPDIVENKYSTKEAFDNLEQKISEIEDKKLQPALARGNVSQTSSRIPLETYRQEAMQNAVDQLKDTGPIEKYFDRLKVKYGDYPTIQQMNEAKRLVAKNISEAGFMSPTYSTDKVVRSTLQKAVEDGAKALGLPDVAQINQEMAHLIKAQDMLSYIEGKPIKTGLVGGLIKDTATVGGELAGNATGIPLAGAYIGREGGGYVGKKLGGISRGILERTSPESIKLTKAQLAKKLGGLFGGAVSQKIQK